jgi:hypothetical protein
MAKYSASEQNEFSEVERSVAEAILYLSNRTFRISPVLKRYLRSPEHFDYELAKQKALVFLRCAEDLKLRGMPVFANKNLRYVLREALKREDFDFFKSVGRVLSREQTSCQGLDDEAFEAASALEKFLISYWIEDSNGTTPLCFLSMRELADDCRKHAGISAAMSEKAIHTIWKRLGLRRITKFKYRGPGLHRISDH